MKEKAIQKIQTEIEESKNPMVQVIGEFLAKHLALNPFDAEKVLDANKTILKSIKEMEKVARKKKVGNMAVLTDQEGFDIVKKYFGLSSGDSPSAPSTQIASTETPRPKKVFDVRLEDFL